jgi:hypothetical protein
MNPPASHFPQLAAGKRAQTGGLFLLRIEDSPQPAAENFNPRPILSLMSAPAR